MKSIYTACVCVSLLLDHLDASLSLRNLLGQLLSVTFDLAEAATHDGIRKIVICESDELAVTRLRDDTNKS